jgi:hypothetical protein
MSPAIAQAYARLAKAILVRPDRPRGCVHVWMWAQDEPEGYPYLVCSRCHSR